MLQWIRDNVTENIRSEFIAVLGAVSHADVVQFIESEFVDDPLLSDLEARILLRKGPEARVASFIGMASGTHMTTHQRRSCYDALDLIPRFRHVMNFMSVCENKSMLMHIHGSFMRPSFDYNDGHEIVARRDVFNNDLMEIQFGTIITDAGKHVASVNVVDMSYPYGDIWFISTPVTRAMLNDVEIVAFNDPLRNMQYELHESHESLKATHPHITHGIVAYASRDIVAGEKLYMAAVPPEGTGEDGDGDDTRETQTPTSEPEPPKKPRKRVTKVKKDVKPKDAPAPIRKRRNATTDSRTRKRSRSPLTDAGDSGSDYSPKRPARKVRSKDMVDDKPKDKRQRRR